MTRSTPSAYVSAVACRLPWRCMTPFGRPVVPELYNQKAGESADVAATAPASGRRTRPPRRRPRPCARRSARSVVIRPRWSANADETTTTRGAGVGDDAGEVVGGEHRRDRHRHDAAAQGAEEPRRERRLVVDDEHDTVTLADTELGQRVLGTEHRRLQVGIGERRSVAADGDPVTPRPAST